MELSTWIAFILASAVLVAMPGPTVLYLIAQSATFGARETLKLVPAVALGVFASITTSLAGAGAVLLASTTLFIALKVAGGLYLIWLGIKTIHQGVTARSGSKEKPARRRFVTAFAISALNPKVLVFYVAFLPQFVDQAAPVLAQFSILTVSFTLLAALNAVLWIVIVEQFNSCMTFDRTAGWLNNISGGLLICAGAFTLKSFRTS